jgi:hypothetical protein
MIGDHNVELTTEELEQLQAWLNTGRVGNMALERPVVPSVRLLEEKPVHVPMGADVKLSEASVRRKEREMERRAKRKLAAEARARKLPRGQRHHKRKQATKRRQALRRWERQPYKSLVYGWGNWAISEEEWNTHLAPFWKLFPAKHLTVKRKWGKGTKDNPYTIWDLKLYYKDKLLWDGAHEVWLHLSQPNRLDIEKAPEGALLFTDSSYSISTLRVVWRGQKGLFIPIEQ